MLRITRPAVWNLRAVLVALVLIACAFAVRVEARRLVAVGDLHGDYEQSISVFRLTGLVDSRNHWIGEDALLIQLGDILDVGPDDIRIVRLLMKLQKEAQLKGGDVIELLGNHELRNFRGDYTAVGAASLAASGGQSGRDKLLSNESDLGGYLRTRKAIFRYGPFLFMHGGFSTATASMITSLKGMEEFNAQLTKALMNGTFSPLSLTGLNLTEDEGTVVSNPILVRSILNVKCDELSKVLDKSFPGIQSVVVGHVPHDPLDFDGWHLCGGRLIDIDFGMSRWKKGDPGHVAALEIEEASWHVQLIETAAAYGPQLESRHPAPDAFAAYHLLGVATLTVLIVLGIFLVSYRITLHTTAGEPLLRPDASQYGTV